jgi:hypothetical protein
MENATIGKKYITKLALRLIYSFYRLVWPYVYMFSSPALKWPFSAVLHAA